MQERGHKVKGLHWLTSILFLALFAFPLYSLKLNNVILILLCILTLILFLIEPVPIGRTVLGNLVFIVPFIPYLIEYVIFSFNPTAHFEFEKKLFFYTAPFFIPVFIQISGFKNYRLALLIFSFSVCVLSIYTLASLFINGIPLFNTAYDNGAFILRDNFERISGLHPTYYSIFALTSACFLFLISVSNRRWIHILQTLFAVMLIITVIFLAVRIAFLTGIVFLLIWIIKTKIKSIQKLMLIFATIVMLILISFAVPSLKNRLSEIVWWETKTSVDNNTVSQRMNILDCSLKVFSNNMLSGTGSRNFQQELNNCYLEKCWIAGSEQHFNPHNQYLSIGINYGIVMLLIFIGCLFIIFRKIYKIQEGKYFFIAILLFFLSESMLERQMGIYFFGLISILLYNMNPIIMAKD